MENGNTKVRPPPSNFSETPEYDSDIYGSGRGTSSQYVVETPLEEDTYNFGGGGKSKSMPTSSFFSTSSQSSSSKQHHNNHYPPNNLGPLGSGEDALQIHENQKRIVSREDEYRKQRFERRLLSPERDDPFSDRTPGPESRTYGDVMMEMQLDKEKADFVKHIRKQQQERDEGLQASKEESHKSGSSKKSSEHHSSSSKNQLNFNNNNINNLNNSSIYHDSDDHLKSKTSQSITASEIKRRRWDQTNQKNNNNNNNTSQLDDQTSTNKKLKTNSVSEWDAPLSNAHQSSRWDTPIHTSFDSTPNAWESETLINHDNMQNDYSLTPITHKKNRWDTAPTPEPKTQYGETPTPGNWGETPSASTPLTKKKTSRWDATPSGMTPDLSTMTGVTTQMTPGTTPFVGQLTPGETPLGQTGLPFGTPLTPVQSIDYMQALRMKSEIEERNRPLTDEELDQLLPSEGYEIVVAPVDYEPARRGVSTITAAPTPMGVGIGGGGVHTSGTPFYKIPSAEDSLKLSMGGSMMGTGLISSVGGGAGGGILGGGVLSGVSSLLASDLGELQIKSEDLQYFGKLFEGGEEEGDLSADEMKERRILALLLRIKNGTPSIRRAALRNLTEKAKEFGPGPLFNKILPLMMQSTLEDQERHLLVKVIDRVLYKLDDQVRPYVHKILVVIEPLLIDEDYYARIEGREIISNLAKAAGLATMIATMRPDIDHADEYVRNTTARAFAVVASALGIPSLILFLKAVCQSKKSWQARHTGIKIVQQIAILMGCGVLPHLRQLVDIVSHGLQDEQQKVRTITALALAALAEASAPYGIEAFDGVLRPLWRGISSHRGKGLAAFLKTIGLIIPLMDSHHASYYTREVMVILVEEFSTPDEEMKKIVLKVVKQCISTEGVEAVYIKNEILTPFFQRFWIVRNALDRRNAKALVETTLEIAKKVGSQEILSRIVEDLKDPSEPYRKMVMETIEAVIHQLGALEIDQRLEELLVDGMLYAFQEQASDDTSIMLSGFGSIVNTLGARIKPYLKQIAGIIRWRLGTPSARMRQQATDLISKIANVMKICDEELMLGHLSLFLFEYLGEEYPEVLGSILGALKAIVNVIGMEKMTPPVKDLLPRLTPILKNRHEKVQENVIELIGTIADRGGDLVSPKEWDRICFDLLELLKAHKKAIRRAAINTFGYIARTIGPHDVLSTLLGNLKVQERQLRVCTTIAIAVVSETCLPYSVLPALMNEYKVPELNVQNGVLKALSFTFEYIGEISKDYIYALLPLLEDALIDRDLVHRQTAAWACKHLALGVHGLGCEDALQHLLNFVWPNIFETSPHLIQAVFDAIDGFHVSLGPSIIFEYLIQGLFHPARRVRETYWRIYNNLYIAHQDALVASYPEIFDISDNTFRRPELYLHI